MRPRAWLALAALLLVALVCAALGAWQVQRLGWKLDLIARVQARLAEAPGAAPGPAQWPALTVEHDEYRRITVSGRYDHARETLVQASTELGPGYWVLTPLRTAEGYWLLVNRGFVPPERRAPAQRSNAATGTQHAVGLLRFSEPGGRFLVPNRPAADRWASRDVAAIAAARGIGGDGLPVAPYFVDLQADPAAPEAWPRPGLTVLQFRNNHLVYALTWFALAAGSLAAALFVLRESRRPPAA